VRRQYLEGKGVPALIGVYQNPRIGRPKKMPWRGPGNLAATRAGVLETIFAKKRN